MNNPINDFTLNVNNLSSVIDHIKTNFPPELTPNCLVLPYSIKCDIDHTKYRGHGRPRNSDYHYEDTVKLLTSDARHPIWDNMKRLIHSFFGHPRNQCRDLEPLAVICECGEIIRLSDYY